MFVQVHGNMPVAAIRKKQALEYRKALQDVPRLRRGELLRATLPAQAAWGREHPEEQRIAAATINKQLGGVQSICIWANDNGLVPEDVQWTDPFSKLRLPEERSERTSFDTAELQLLFSAAVFTEHQFPLGARGDAGFWLPTGKFGARFRATPSLLRFCGERGVDPAKALDHFEFEYDLPEQVLELRATKEDSYWMNTRPPGKPMSYERDGVTNAIEGHVRELNGFFAQQKLRGGRHHGYPSFPCASHASL
jgi:hypothetical protein